LRILILVDCYYPSTKSSAKLVHDLAAELSRRGHELVVLTPSDTIAGRAERKIEEGITVVRVKTGRIKGAGKWQRGLREARLSSDLWRGAQSYLRENPCELILFYSPTIFFGSLVQRLKKLWLCPAYMILRDIFPDWAVDAQVLRSGLVERYFRRVAAQQYRAADVIAVQSPANRAHFTNRFPNERFRIEVLYNWSPDAEPGLPRTQYRKVLGLEGKTVFLYGGNIGVAQDIDNLLRLAARFEKRPDVHFILVGEGSEVPRLRRLVGYGSLANVHLIAGLPQDEYLSAVSEFDAGLISLDARLTSHNVPGKLLSYLFWGIPVLASVNPGNDLFDLLADGNAGLCLKNGDDDALYRAALRIADDPAVREAMGRNARQLLEDQFSVANAVDSIFQHLNCHGLIHLPGRESDTDLRTVAALSPEFAEKS
jgi:O26-antigen biosynthesis N-acetyl-L-fucosamine transferase